MSRTFLRPAVVIITIFLPTFLLAQTDYRIEDFVTSWSIEDDDITYEYPSGMAIDDEGHVYVAVDGINGQHVQIFDRGGSFLTQFGGLGSEAGQFWNLNDVAVDSWGTIYVSDHWNRRVQKFTRSGSGTTMLINYVSSFPTVSYIYGYVYLAYPYKLTFNSTGNIYVAGYAFQRVMKYAKDGTFNPTDPGYPDPGDPLPEQPPRYPGYPISVAFDSQDNLYVITHYNESSTTGGDRLYKYDALGNLMDEWDLHGTGDGQVNRMTDIFIDRNNFIHITDQGNHRVVVFAPDMQFLGWFGKGTQTTGWHEPGSGENGMSGTDDGEFTQPQCLHISNEGYLYVGDVGDWDGLPDPRIQKFSTTQLTPQEIAEDIVGMVDALADEGSLNGGQHNALVTKLDAVIEHINWGEIKNAVNKLNAFINQVTEFIYTGVLTSEEGRPLIDWAYSLDGNLNNG